MKTLRSITNRSETLFQLPLRPVTVSYSHLSGLIDTIFEPFSLPPLSPSLSPPMPEIPQKVLSKVELVMSMAHEGETSLFKASELLDGIFEAYQYARAAAGDKYDIQRRSQRLLDKYDESFKQMIRSRINTNIPDAEMYQAQCFEELSKFLHTCLWIP